MKPSYKQIVSFIWVVDWDRALTFYRNVLGFSLIFEADGWAELSIPGVPNASIALNRRATDEPPPRNEFVTLHVDDLDAFRAHLDEHGVEQLGVWDFPEHSLRLLKFVDPDGNRLAVSQLLR